MANLSQVKAQADTAFASLWVEVSASQDSYNSKHAKYFQSLISPDEEVVNAEAHPFIVVSPSDEKHAEDVDRTWGGDAPFQVYADELQGESSAFTLGAVMRLDDGLFGKRKSSTGDEHDWTKIETLPS